MVTRAATKKVCDLREARGANGLNYSAYSIYLHYSELEYRYLHQPAPVQESVARCRKLQGSVLPVVFSNIIHTLKKKKKEGGR